LKEEINVKETNKEIEVIIIDKREEAEFKIE
jgi:hypothetical protein